jgi:hypothetical protein
MKQLLKRSALSLIIFALSITSCRKEGFLNSLQGVVHNQELIAVPKYSTIGDFRQGIQQVVNLIISYRIDAYLDTLPNGFPDLNGRRVPLSQFGYSILEKLGGSAQQIESAVYDVFHFDGSTFSLISYLMKAYWAGKISYQTLVNILILIPLPPIPMVDFTPPLAIPAIPATGDCCKDNTCNPVLKILVTWGYKPPCGNYEKKTSGFAANNTLTKMSSGKMYRFDAEISGCPCPGTLTSTVTAPAGASYGTGTGKDGSVTLLPVTSGTYMITFTYKVCDQVITKTFTLGIG